MSGARTATQALSSMSNPRQDSAGVPHRPKLRRCFHVVPLHGQRLMFTTGHESVVMSGESVSNLLPLLLPQLDGTRTVEEVVEALSPSVAGHVVVEALRLLHSKGLLEDAFGEMSDRLPQAFRDRLSHQLTFFSLVGEDKYKYQERLFGAKVTIIGAGGLGAASIENLASAGVGELVCVDERSVSPADQIFASSFEAGHVNQKRVCAVADLLAARHPGLKFVGVDAQPRTPNDLLRLIAGSATVIVCGEAPSTPLWRLVNEACLSAEIPWIRAYVHNTKGFVGPCVIPFQSPCYTCFELRMKSNVTSLDEYMAFEAYREHGEHAGAEVGLLNATVHLISGYACVEAVKLITRFAYPPTCGQLHAIDFLTFEVSRHEILKLPRCPACGPLRKRPQMKIWNIAPSTTEG
jgi:bacteriocin biosynthesis cyclodehydratase domain-containing protein